MMVMLKVKIKLGAMWANKVALLAGQLVISTVAWSAAVTEFLSDEALAEVSAGE